MQSTIFLCNFGIYLISIFKRFFKKTSLYLNFPTKFLNCLLFIKVLSIQESHI